jgi:pheromone shutdown protein TraB
MKVSLKQLRLTPGQELQKAVTIAVRFAAQRTPFDRPILDYEG